MITSSLTPSGPELSARYATASVSFFESTPCASGLASIQSVSGKTTLSPAPQHVVKINRAKSMHEVRYPAIFGLLSLAAAGKEKHRVALEGRLERLAAVLRLY